MAGGGVAARSFAGHMEADVATAFGHVRAFRQSWSEPIDIVGVSAHHWLQLSLLPSTRTERGRFPEHWQPHHFEPIGELFLLPARQPVHTRSECRAQVTVACAFEPEAVQAWLDDGFEWTDVRLKGSLDLECPTIRDLLVRLRNEIRNPGLAGEVLIELMAGQIAVELGRHFRLLGERRPAGGLASWRLRAIEERLTEVSAPPSLQELARLVGLSVRQLARGFRASHGCSIGAHVATVRAEQAKRLLSSGACVKAVADALGFSSTANFTAAFRRATGETPRVYQARAAKASVSAITRG